MMMTLSLQRVSTTHLGSLRVCMRFQWDARPTVYYRSMIFRSRNEKVERERERERRLFYSSCAGSSLPLTNLYTHTGSDPRSNGTIEGNG